MGDGEGAVNLAYGSRDENSNSSPTRSSTSEPWGAAFSEVTLKREAVMLGMPSSMSAITRNKMASQSAEAPSSSASAQGVPQASALCLASATGRRLSFCCGKLDADRIRLSASAALCAASTSCAHSAVLHTFLISHRGDATGEMRG